MLVASDDEDEEEEQAESPLRVLKERVEPAAGAGSGLGSIPANPGSNDDRSANA